MCKDLSQNISQKDPEPERPKCDLFLSQVSKAVGSVGVSDTSIEVV